MAWTNRALLAISATVGVLIGCGTGAVEPSDHSGSASTTTGGSNVTIGTGGTGGGSPSATGSASTTTTAAAGGAATTGSTSTTGGPTGAGGSGGAGGAGGTGGSGGMMGPVIPPADRGATVPYLEYEAEDGDTNGTKIGPSRTLGEIPSEASARRAVRLDATGQYVHITNKRLSNAIVVRYAIPDSANGTGMSATISVYVNGTFKKKLPLTSRYSWTYGPFGNAAPNSPSSGVPHHFFDESHAIVGDIPMGAMVSVQRDTDDTAPYVVVDLIDLEYVEAPLPKPAQFLSITTDCGAVPDDDGDDQVAIQKCIDSAKATNRGLYIPAGTFKSLAKPLSVDNLTIRGAGMWYSVISGINARVDCYGNACKYYDFAVFGDTTVRDDRSGESCFSGVTGNGTLLENIWMEHSKTGYWVGPNASNFTIRKSRIRDMYADGVNLWNNISNSIIEQTHLRNTGDDALAMWSENKGAANRNNVYRFNTVQLPWMANCFGIYGGVDNRLEDNVCMDVVQYPGILIGQQFNSQPFGGTTSILRNTLIRAGGFAYNEGQGAIKIYAEQGNIAGILVQDMIIQDPTFSGIQLQGRSRVDARFERVAISGAGTSGIQVNFDANGVGTANTLTVTNGGLHDDSKGAFSWAREAGNAGW